MVLEIKGISKQYERQTAVDPISFSVSAGEIVGFLGPNGAGKSTTMKIITGCLQADGGEVVVAGYDLKRQPLLAKATLGYLPEDNPLYEDLYVEEYLRYVARLYKPKQVADDVKQAMLQTGLLPEAHKKIGQLSKGYRQRVGLAQAILHNPKLLVLDEPTSGLDPNQADEIIRLLRSLSPGKAILFSSHTLSEVASICTRILILHHGKIVADLPASEITDLETTFRELTREGEPICKS